MNYERLEDLLSAHGARPYSGRGMSGRKCLSVQTEDGYPLMKLLSDIITGCEDVYEAAELLRKVRTDDMGRETVLYWPSVRVPENTP